MLFKIRILCIFLFFQLYMVELLYAQPDTITNEALSIAFDSNYIEDFTDVLTTRIFLLFQNASLLINTTDENVSRIVYRPNVNLRIGLGGFWKWFGLGLSIDNPFYKTDRNVYGKTTTLDLRINAFGRTVAGEFFFQQYKSFFISTPGRPDGTHYIVPDMKTVSIGISGYYIYNSKKFSIRAAFIQNEVQKKSAGSFVVRPAFLFYSISSDKGIIPEEIILENQIPQTNLVSRGNFYSIELSPGYVYSLIFLKHFYLTAAVFPGVAAQFSSYSNELTAFSEFEFAFQLSGRFAFGYNSDKWFLGGSYQIGFNEVPDILNKALFNYDIAQFRLWGGTRFDIFKKRKSSISLYH